jgi:ubiquinone/menaquinone biosynthesis C-methylase UbiE
MKPSDIDDVRAMYEATADSYAQMMDEEIRLPVYVDVLERLRRRIEGAPGPLVDTACGSGHMLQMYHDRFDADRPLLGVDLSPRMVQIASERLGPAGRVEVGDMCVLSQVESGTAAALMNFFAVQHLDPNGVRAALNEWRRVLRPGGRLLIAAWEGSGAIDYGEEADLVALRYTGSELEAWAGEAGFEVERCRVEPVEEFPMDAVYLEGAKQ